MKKIVKLTQTALLVGVFAIAGFSATVTGDRNVWHTVTVTFDGPAGSEADAATFLDYRFTVIFTNGSASFTVPGFFAADGNAAVTHAASGNKWQARFTPNIPGTWTYAGVMSSGSRIAISSEDGTQVALEGSTGSFDIAASPVSPTDRDFRGKGRLNYVGGHYMQFEGTGGYFIKGGAGSPENMLGYYGFDGTFDAGGNNIPGLGSDQIHNYEPHSGDWNAGDPNWTDEDGDEGKNIIGFVNYNGEAGINSQYFLTMNYQGDGWEVWPWTNFDERETFDVSKLDQWEILFAHMEKNGILLHIFLTETENESLFEYQDGGTFAHTRKLYYREIIARFGHHLGVIWNLGEENGHNSNGAWGAATSAQQMKDFSAYIQATDPYDHPVVVHNYPFEQDKILDPLLGYEYFNGTSLQVDQPYLDNKGWDFNEEVRRWVADSRSNGRPWLVNVDEPLGWEYGLITDADNSGRGVSQDDARKELMWGTYMAGGAGVEWYFGFASPDGEKDLDCENMRMRANMWEKTKIATDFFLNNVRFNSMSSANNLLSGAAGYVLADPGRSYLVYLKNGGSANLDLGGQSGSYTVKWFDPRNGGALQDGPVTSVAGGSSQSLGNPPANAGEDWAVLVSNSDTPVERIASQNAGTPNNLIINNGRLTYENLRTSICRVTLMSINGVGIDLFNGLLEKGNHNFSLPKNIESGIHILKVSSENKVFTRSVIIN